MIDGFKRLLQRLSEPDEAANLAGDELQLATAALMVHAAAVDGHIGAAERDVLKAMMERHFALSHEDAVALVDEAEERERSAVDIYSFTRVLQGKLEQEDRQHIVELMWEVVAADGEVHPYESNLVWRAAELIGVSTRDRVTLRQEVFARHGMDGSS
ncbi:MAG: TerB family tellurite resistance protein [Rhizobiales bacterium]|nr:TerB family tellurite resistance protein [Hyphomicrobiales bacterium]